MINPDDIKVGVVLGQTDAMILRAAVARLNGLELEILALRKGRDIPEGWKLVPVDPDWNMLSADGCKEHHKGQPCLHHDNRKRIWSAMLAAAPTPNE
jgi:hypothetical protein